MGHLPSQLLCNYNQERQAVEHCPRKQEEPVVPWKTASVTGILSFNALTASN